MTVHSAILLGSLSMLMACAGPSPADCASDGQEQPSCLQQQAQPSRSLQGRSLQGRSLQGRSLQGRSLQGTDPAVSTVTGIRIGGVAVENIQISGTLLTGSLNGQAVSGTDFVGATVIQQDIDGSAFDSTITNVQLDPQDPSGEIFLYTITAFNPDTGTVENICSPDPGGGQYATPVYGSWNFSGEHVTSTTQFLFGCTSGVVAKCVRWGYKPWKSVNGVPLADYHQTCTRMARADYCGDGVSHTENGTLIDLYDDLHIQDPTPFDLQSPLFFEAAWSPQGAYCLTKDRWLQLSTLASTTYDCKLKFFDLFPLFETSPVNSQDHCIVKRSDVSRSQVRIDTRSGVNISLQ